MSWQHPAWAKSTGYMIFTRGVGPYWGEHFCTFVSDKDGELEIDRRGTSSKPSENHWMIYKDFTITERDTPTLCEVGEGNLNWKEINAASREIGVEYYSIEQDRDFPGRNIFDSMQIRLSNMRKFGFA